MNNDLQKNADRFTGFSDIYDGARPRVPEYPAEIIIKYLKRRPETVVDLGCGTGLSSLVWTKFCKNAIGIEPSEDMLEKARSRKTEGLRFIKAFAHDTGLNDEITDAVVCSQSFHWMEPNTPLREVDRILKPGGIFAAIDCDWPPVVDAEAEMEYDKLYSKAKRLEKELGDVKNSFIRYDKNKHLENIKNSGYFMYAREIVFSNAEPCDAERFINILLSQGSVQEIVKKHPDLICDDLDAFKTKIHNIFGSANLSIGFCYRMRIGVKKQ